MSEPIYFANFITPEEESELLAFIDQQPWNTDLKRRTQHYGFKYSYDSKNIDSSSLGEIPEAFLPILDKIEPFFPKRPEQIIVNEYLPGQGIAPHIDRFVFGPVVASLSLSSGVVMNLEYENEKKDLHLERRSLLVLSGKYRTLWKHGIVPRKSDLLDGQRQKRGRRVSVTFRTLV